MDIRGKCLAQRLRKPWAGPAHRSRAHTVRAQVEHKRSASRARDCWRDCAMSRWSSEPTLHPKVFSHRKAGAVSMILIGSDFIYKESQTLHILGCTHDAACIFMEPHTKILRQSKLKIHATAYT